MAINVRVDDSIEGDRLIFEETPDRTLFDVDLGQVKITDENILADEEVPYGRVVSNALTSVEYTSPSGEKIIAEVFDPADGERLPGDYEIYPLDGTNRPYTVDGGGVISLETMARRSMGWYSRRRVELEAS